jgi:hypothetical protein
MLTHHWYPNCDVSQIAAYDQHKNARLHHSISDSDCQSNKNYPGAIHKVNCRQQGTRSLSFQHTTVILYRKSTATMHLFDLPLECFRHMMTFVTPLYGTRLHELLRLRLTSRVMDAEVLHILQTPGLHERAFSGVYFVPASYLDFAASFLNTRPFRQDPWDSNMSSILNHVVDEVISDGGLDLDDSARKIIMKELCHKIFQVKRWPCHSSSFSMLSYKPDMDWPDKVDSPELRELMFPRHMHFTDEVGPLSFVVLLANVLLGRQKTLELESIPALLTRKSSVFGTLLEVVIKSGELDLAATLLDTGVNVNDISLKVLENAIECDRKEMMGLIFSPKYALSRPTQTLPDRLNSHSRIQRGIQQAARWNYTESFLYLARTFDMSTMPRNASFAFEQACRHNNFRIARTLFDELGAVRPTDAWLVSLVPRILHCGHQDMVSFLLERGFTRKGEI